MSRQVIPDVLPPGQAIYIVTEGKKKWYFHSVSREFPADEMEPVTVKVNLSPIKSMGRVFLSTQLAKDFVNWLHRVPELEQQDFTLVMEAL